MTFPIPNLISDTGYMCLNADCFYCETFLSHEDVVWREAWCSKLEDVVPIPHCPSCEQNMIQERLD